MNHSEIVLQVGGEGGDVTLYGVRTKTDWLFSRKVIDQSLLLLDEPSIQHGTGSMATRPEALELIDQYPWQHLYPVVVHPECRAMILAAVVARYKSKRKRNPAELSHWKELCSVVGDEPTFQYRQRSCKPWR